jgi:Aldo/keto reductase family
VIEVFRLIEIDGKEFIMEYTHLGRIGLKVSRLCLGTMNFGPETSEADSFAIMDRALEHGINFFDTANAYGGQKGVGPILLTWTGPISILYPKDAARLRATWDLSTWQMECPIFVEGWYGNDL